MQNFRNFCAVPLSGKYFGFNFLVDLFISAFPVRNFFQLDIIYSTALLTASAGIAGWIEFLLIRRALTRKIGYFSLGGSAIGKGWIAALVASIPGISLNLLMPPFSPVLRGVLILGIYGSLYLSITKMLGLEAAKEALQLVARRFKR